MYETTYYENDSDRLNMCSKLNGRQRRTLALTDLTRVLFIHQEKIRSKIKATIEATMPTPYKRKALER